jgi:hypothetical protein
VDGLDRVRVQTHDDGWTVATDRLSPSAVAALFTSLVAMPLFGAGIFAVGALLDLALIGTVQRSFWLLAGLPGVPVFGALWLATRGLVRHRIRLDDEHVTVDETARSLAGIRRVERTDGWVHVTHPDGDLRVQDPDSRVYDGLVAAIERYDAPG